MAELKRNIGTFGAASVGIANIISIPLIITFENHILFFNYAFLRNYL